MEEADANAKEEGLSHPQKVPEGTCHLGTPSVVLDHLSCLTPLTVPSLGWAALAGGDKNVGQTKIKK